MLNALGIGAVLLGGRCADRFGRYRALVPSMVLLALCQGLLLIVHNPLSFIAVALMQGVACFVNPLPTIVMGDALPPRSRPTGIAVYRAVCDTAILSAPASMGLAIQMSGFGAAEWLNFGVAGIGTAGVALLYAASRANYVVAERAQSASA
jgi:MFS family permease